MVSFLARASGVFLPLRSSVKFREAFVAHGTVCWPGDIDIDPKLLYQQSIPELKMESRRIGVEKGPIDVSDEQHCPFDVEWERMPGVGLEEWSEDGDD